MKNVDKEARNCNVGKAYKCLYVQYLGGMQRPGGLLVWDQAGLICRVWE